MFVFRRALWIALAALVLVQIPGSSQAPQTKVVPKLEPIAETKLVMEGVAHINFRGLERILTEKPAEEKAWTFARAQALLIAESANLMMLRPPQKDGQATWFERAMALRSDAAQLAKTVVTKDLDKSRAALLKVAASCNRCHQSFRVPVQIAAFEEK